VAGSTSELSRSGRLDVASSGGSSAGRWGRSRVSSSAGDGVRGSSRAGDRVRSLRAGSRIVALSRRAGSRVIALSRAGGSWVVTLNGARSGVSLSNAGRSRVVALRGGGWVGGNSRRRLVLAISVIVRSGSGEGCNSNNGGEGVTHFD